MSKQDHFKFHTGVVAYPIFFVLIIWLIFWFEVRFGYNFSKYGIYPHTYTGLRGVFLSPFIHSSIKHLYHNTIPVFVLIMAMFYFYRHIAWKVILLGIILSGFLTWCIGRPSYHIGASGLIYVLISFTFFKGIYTKHYRLIALSLVVVFLYGSLIWQVLPLQEAISWEGHLAGLTTGFLFALFFKKEIAKPKKYAWEEAHYNEDTDPFLKQFDENGNFIESKNEEIEQENQLNITLSYKEKNND